MGGEFIRTSCSSFFAESVALYEEGMRLAEQCQVLLADVEQRIDVLRQRANGG